MKLNLRRNQIIVGFKWDGENSTIEEIEKELSVFDDSSVNKKGEGLYVSVWNGYSGTSINIALNNYIVIDTNKIPILTEYTEESLKKEYTVWI